MFDVTNDEGRTFRVRVIYHEDGEPRVQFSDLTYAGDPTKPDWIEHGQPVARYYVDTILGEDEWSSGGEGGLCLDGGVPVWTIDAEAMDRVRAYLRGAREAAAVVVAARALVSSESVVASEGPFVTAEAALVGALATALGDVGEV